MRIASHAEGAILALHHDLHTAALVGELWHKHDTGVLLQNLLRGVHFKLLGVVAAHCVEQMKMRSVNQRLAQSDCGYMDGALSGCQGQMVTHG